MSDLPAKIKKKAKRKPRNTKKKKDPPKKTSAKGKLIDRLADFQLRPYDYVLWAYPWGEEGTELEKCEGPEPWQEKTLKELQQELHARFDEKSRNEAIVKTMGAVIRFARRSGNGVGKSALVSWLIHWAISTKVDTRGVVTANTETQLREKTWAELQKWQNLWIAKSLFTITATALYANDKAHQKNWRIDCVPWSEHNPDAFAGLHNKGKRIILLFDESSGIKDKIWEISEGALTDKDTQIMWLCFGNPLHNTGEFFNCFEKNRHRWNTDTIDARTVSLSNKKLIAEWIEDHGEDGEHVRVHAKGLPPKSAISQFIPSEWVAKAYGLHLRDEQFNFAPVIIGVDNAWEGLNKTVITLRQGLMCKILSVIPKNSDDTVVAGIVAGFDDQYHADAVFIDMGYGTGIYSYGKHLGRKHWHLVAFGGDSSNPGYLNKRMEMWAGIKDWLKNGGSVPPDKRLAADLSGPNYYTHIRTGKTMLEKKSDMEQRGLSSPDYGDSLALTFAFPVTKRRDSNQLEFAKGNYDPMSKENLIPLSDYDPLA
jgi:hypothetical protein